MTARREPIAIVGMGCRLPGGANDPAAFWRLLRDGIDAISEIPDDRPELKELYDPRPGTPGRIASRYGGFLSGLDLFDPAFFGISPREANAVDPQQRLLLETTWEAMEDAGIVPAALAGHKVGVFVGMWTNEYEDRMFAAIPNVDLYITTGGGRYAASGRLSYTFDLRGPSLTLDTACSSSLVAIHLASQSLRSGESEVALVGATNLMLTPHISIGYSRSRMLSPDGRCRFGDASAHGYVRSEGVGVVVLKPLARALADGDRVHAVIRGSAVNNDGRSSGLLVAPGADTQKAMLRDAYEDAGVDPAQVAYVEAHGTGTGVGDPVELEALGAVLGRGRPAGRPCAIGSVKTNIGHAEAASGLAGLIKAALCLEHGEIPPSLHFETPNPKIPWDELPLRIETRLEPWPAGAPAVCGVNSFGVTGTNAHVVLEGAPPETSPPSPPEQAAARLLPLSGASAGALLEAARRHRDWLAADGRAASLADVCHTAGARRTHHEHRLAVAGRSHQDLIAGLEAFLAGETRPGLASGRRPAEAAGRVVLVFPGQGSQWLGMGRQLLAVAPAFRDALEACAHAVKAAAGWSVLDEIHASAEASRLEDISVTQPTLFAMQVALAALWRDRGVEPAAVVGHSMGEVAAAHVAGALSLEDAARVICRRSELMKRVSGRGAMAVVELAFDAAQEAIDGFGGRLSVAVSNSSRSTVVSGDTDAIEELLRVLEKRDVFARRVKVDVASHSPHMDPLTGDLAAALEGLEPRPATVPLLSTVTGRPIAGTELDSRYWVRNLREPVRFSSVVRSLAESGHDLFLEVSPHPVLVSAIQQELAALGSTAVGLATLVREEDEPISLLGALGALYCRGLDVDWRRQDGRPGRVVSLPTYPWQRERYWYEPAGSPPAQRPVQGLLGPHLGSSVDPGHFWESEIGIERMAYLADHRVKGAVVLPAAAFCDLALAAAGELTGAAGLLLDDLRIEQALVLPASGVRRVQVALTQANGPSWTVRISSQAPDDTAREWTLHARGVVRGESPAARAVAPSTTDLSAADPHFAALADRGLEYGPAFRAVRGLASVNGVLWGRVRLPEGLSTAGHRIHPSLLDAAFQLGVSSLPPATEGRTWLPAGIRRLRWLAPAEPAEASLWASAQPARAGDSDASFLTDVTLADDRGRVLVEIEGLELVRLEPGGRDELEGAFFAPSWTVTPLADELDAPSTGGSWLVLPDRRGMAERLARALEQAGHSVRVGDPADVGERARLCGLLDAATRDGRVRGIVYLASLDAPSAVEQGASALDAAQAVTCDAPTRLVQVLAERADDPAPRVWLVSAGAQAVRAGEAPAVEQAPLWGLGRVAAGEHPELRCSLVDLSRDAGEVEALARELGADHDEDAVALRGPDRLVPRLLPWRAAAEAPAPRVPVDGRAFRAVTATPGILDGIGLHEMLRRAPGAGEVEIGVEATGLNFMNVMSALGACPGYPQGVGPLGIECAGRVTALGEGVRGLREGDPVFGVAFDSLASHAIADARLVRARPAGLSPEQAATVPIVYLTVHYAFEHLARLRRGERVLIHAAAGGVGLAAIQLAQRVGAEIFATAGSPEKRALVESLGVRHVLDSRSVAFREQIRELTGGDGVDVVLNSLAGEFVAASLDVLRPYGRFLEIGKKDIYGDAALGLAPFRRNLSYFAIDLDRMIRERPDRVASLLDEVVTLLDAGAVSPVAVKAYPVSRVADAFRDMAQARHTGKIAITLDDREARLEPRDANLAAFTSGSCLITGGLGALGLAFARRLAKSGARTLVLAGRRPPTADAAAAIAVIEAEGARVRVVLGDVASPADARRLASEIESSLPRLSGIVHAAGLLDDGILLQQTPERFAHALAPKVQGAWHMHELAERHGASLVAFSSVASLLGLAGQANYAAGNAFLDALAHYRRARGQAGLSINWGPWAGIGLAAAQANRGERLGARGLVSLSPAAGLEAFDRILSADPVQVAVMRLDWPAYVAASPAAARASLLRVQADAAREPSADAATAPRAGGFAEGLRAAEPASRRALLESFVQEQAAQVLKQARNRIDLHRPFRTLGLDSLMALELRNRLEAGLGVSLPATIVWNYPTVAALAPFLAQRLDLALEQGRAPEPATGPAADDDVEALLAEVERLSTEDARRLLVEEPPEDSR